MKSINTYYTTNSKLEEFIVSHNIEDNSSLLIQIFTAFNEESYIQNLLDSINSLLPQAIIIGSTTDGEIMDGKVSQLQTVLGFTQFEQTTLSSSLVDYDHCSSYYEGGQIIAQNLITADTKLIIAFSDGIRTNGEAFLDGISSVDNHIIVAGGMAGDRAEFIKTLVFDKEKIISHGVVAVALHSQKLSVHTHYNFNWKPIGKKLTITKADANRVYEIDGKSAVETYGHYLGQNIANNLPAVGIEFPLVIYRNDVLVAHALIDKKEDGSLVFAGSFKEGDIVSLAYGDIQEILRSSMDIYQDISINPSESIFIYSCMARRHFMPNEIESEIKPLQSIASTVGFFTNGEFFTQKKSSASNTRELLNQTITIVSLSESPEKTKLAPKQEEFNESSMGSSIAALTHLINVTSKEVEAQTIELNQFNKNLEEKIKIAVDNLKEKDKQLLHQARLAEMGETIGMIAHQWKQPLNTLSILIQDIVIKYQSDRLQDIHIENFDISSEKQITQMSQTIDDFRNFFKPQKEKVKFSLNQVINNIVSLESPLFTKHTIAFTYESKTPITLYGYPNELGQVFINIIHNAKDALIENQIENRKIDLDITTEEENIIIHISDNAGGIPEAVIHKIFDPYFSTKEEKNGTGLGLYMCKMIIVDNMGGEISINNTHEGACFTIKLKSNLSDKQKER
ncbi:MAG: FIST N-terminal domain-containing protein [Campylobacterota bacterium]|nr:FIST N-terminal domain-containing protein [Campylobacterota bacterium]